MKILFFSDVHGDAASLSRVLEKRQQFGIDQLVMLGDALYHGPRNIIKDDYDPKGAVPLFNSVKDNLIAVRGNCDAEVDQMLLEFPVLGDYSTLYANGHKFFLTHGHLWNENHLPPVGTGTILVHGHTHIPVLKRLDCGLILMNPGSISLPKGGYPPSYGLGTETCLEIRELDTDKVMFAMELRVSF